MSSNLIAGSTEEWHRLQSVIVLSDEGEPQTEVCATKRE